MPSYKQLVQGGRSDLAGAVQRWGGAAEVAKRLGLPCGIRPRSSSHCMLPASFAAMMTFPLLLCVLHTCRMGLQ